MSSHPSAYESWTREALITRLSQLESHRKPTAEPLCKRKVFDFSAHPRRKIALKFTYNGADYSGLEFQKTPTTLPTVEAVLFDALVHTRLIDPATGFEGCGWEKCGRTDRGVSAAGQVISLWVRSALGQARVRTSLEDANVMDVHPVEEQLSSETSIVDSETGLEGDLALMGEWDETPTNAARPATPQATNELRYITLLNNVLPPTIRVIAWSPVGPDFSARFSCRYRHYKYFFSPEGLDLAAMQDAADRLVGEHDFRNLCKLDPSKQLTTFARKILSARLNPAQADGASTLYVLDLIGTAFLYNQVRHIMAVLFLVGTKLEHPSVIDALLNVDAAQPRAPSRPGEPFPQVIPSKPEYQMADPLPLMLWECAYDKDAVSWRTGDGPLPTEGAALSHRDLSNNLYHSVHALHQRSVVQTAMDAHFLRAVAAYHAPPPQYFPIDAPGVQPVPSGSVLSIPLGAGTVRRGARYVPLVERPRGDLVEAVNERWRTGKGARQMERKALAAQASGQS